MPLPDTQPGVPTGSPWDHPATHDDLAAAINDLTGAVVEGVGVSKITVGTSEPADPQVGDLWVDTN